MYRSRSNNDFKVAVVSELESILCGGRQVVASSTTALVVGNPPTAPQRLEAALHKVVPGIPGITGEVTLDGLALWLMLEVCPTLRTVLK